MLLRMNASPGSFGDGTSLFSSKSSFASDGTRFMVTGSGQVAPHRFAQQTLEEECFAKGSALS